MAAVFTLAQAANQAADGIVYPLLFGILAVELTLGGFTWAAFNAESRIAKDRDDDIRDSVAGYSSGLVLPAVARLIEDVLEVRGTGEPIGDALVRADISAPLDEVVDAAAASRAPRALEASLVRVWTFAGFASLLVQIAGPLVLLNTVLSDEVLSSTVETVSGVAVVSALAILGALLFAIRILAQSLTRATRVGKDAGDGA